MNCSAEQREQVRRAADAIRDCPSTASVDTLSPVESQYDQWTIDAVLQTGRGVPPEVLRELAIEGLILRPTPSQGCYAHVVATV